MYKKVLVTSNGEYLSQIVEHSLEIISRRGIEVIGLYVVDNSFSPLISKKVKQMILDELKIKGKETLDLMEKEFRFSASKIKFSPLLIEGNPASEIIKTAHNEDVDIIVIGTGKNKIDKYLLGSVSEKVVHASPCSILLVRV
jgi:nucleotide-binding universal stress UspA family protein